MITINNLTKTYKNFKAVDSISLTAKPGEVTVLLGPNGAGKSTTIKSIAGLLKFEGDITICDFPNKTVEAKKVFGYIPETPALYDFLTPWEHAQFIAKAYKLDDTWEQKIKTIFERLEIYDKKDKYVRELSKGMTQKLSIAIALLIDPRAVLFDEPLVGLDPKAINEVLKIFEELKSEGKSILVSTHIIDTINEVWDRAYIMNKGKIIRDISRDELEGRDLKTIFFELTEGETEECGQ
ncbi:ABC transporter ATP-binding protein [Ruminiclostridium cellobioparum]|jgi:ABC-2 type transport system ATP-binding protein|uniref:ABC-type multidrug transport system, ATPase component n=1 Tax=Ruminiclostridium cellobioparum subsp. termitidis CT1112 TaxID=1195236 RepID=S0FR35_RUMCE|nr:ABC transporter ATP-binding protein [Ruminiclostridium cellobioparum]EMS70923.1 ABC-type multidrug transport system, ATPase component [Ruminiclostridium cellobioparum subsp. termitidis CT1112]